VTTDHGQEMKKAKIKLPLPEEAEWLGYFTAEKAKAQARRADHEDGSGDRCAGVRVMFLRR